MCSETVRSYLFTGNLYNIAAFIDLLLLTDLNINLTELDLSSCRIERIEPGAFNGLLQLQELDLSCNRLCCVNAHMFIGASFFAGLVEQELRRG